MKGHLDVAHGNSFSRLEIEKLGDEVRIQGLSSLVIQVETSARIESAQGSLRRANAEYRTLKCCRYVAWNLR